jgi:hypothetical protein
MLDLLSHDHQRHKMINGQYSQVDQSAISTSEQRSSRSDLASQHALLHEPLGLTASSLLSAGTWLSLATWLAVAAGLLAALLSWWGLAQRIEEYR